MPEPIGRNQRYMPGLDGLRAVAVLGVVAYHLGFRWAPGGLLGVGVFFTLSGYLITDLLLGEFHSLGRLQLGDFWIRRARRLLPALLLMLAVVAVWVAIVDRSQLASLRGGELAATFYVGNWWLIFQHISYFARFGPPSPIGNLWSLGVEEQFYLIWPWLLALGLWWVRGSNRSLPPRLRARRWARKRGVLVAITLALALLSAIEMGVLYHPGQDPTRIYDGTDTRIFAILLGAALAMVWPSRGLRADVTRGARNLIDGMGAVGLVIIGILIWQTNEYSAFLYRGGMVLLSVATLLVILAATHPASRIGAALGWFPLRWIGVRSYAIYLWQYPIIVLTSGALLTTVNPVGAGSDDLPRAIVQLAAILVVSALSWTFVESPIRHGAIGRIWHQLRDRKWGIATATTGVWAAITGVALLLVVAGVGLAGALPGSSGTSTQNAAAGGENLHLGHVAPSGKVIHTTTTPTTSPPASTVPGVTTTLASPQTSCQSVVDIGDSTSESLISDDYLDPSEQLPAQYGRVGVQNVNLQISGARSIVETYQGEPNAYTVAQQLLSQGYHGCWVIAMGTNDAADVAVGSNVGMPDRVQRMMQLIGDQPVMWVNVLSLLSSGPYSESEMQQWDQALLQACPQYPNMRVYDWASVAQNQPSWFISDGIHYTSAGSQVRAADMANALAGAFPANPPPVKGKSGKDKAAQTGNPNCVVH